MKAFAAAYNEASRLKPTHLFVYDGSSAMYTHLNQSVEKKDNDISLNCFSNKKLCGFSELCAWLLRKM